MNEPQEFKADNGDVWYVRECDGEDGCIIVERFRYRRPDDAFTASVLRAAGVEPNPGGVEDEPCEEIHIPADMAALIGKALFAASKTPATAEE